MFLRWTVGGQVAGQRLLERDAVFRAVRPALRSARNSRTASVFLVGEAGLGKSSVLSAAVRRAAGFQVLHSRGEAAEVSLPFGFLAQVVGLAQAEDVLAPVTDLPAAERAAAAWYRLRRWASADRPVPLLLALDDLHWADPDSLTLLRLLIQQVRAAPMAIIATLRPWPSAAAELVAEVTAGGLGTAARLRPLSPAASAELLGRLTGAPPGADLAGRLEEQCAGNPLLLHQLAHELQRQTGPEIPIDVTDPGRLLLSTFTGLDPAGLDFARAAAVCGVQFHPQVAATLAGLSGVQARDALTGLCQAGLVRSADRGLAGFTHALLQHALYEDLPEPVRVQLHAATFQLLWQQGVPAAEAARHAIAGHLHDTNAVTCLEQAGLDASSHGALDAATQWLTAAVELAGPRAEPSLRLRLADALYASGAPARAADICKALLRGRQDPAPPWAAEAYRLLGRLMYEMGEIAQAAQSLEHAARLAADTNRRLAAEALLEASLQEFTLTGPRRALRFADDAARLLTNESDPELVAWVAAARGNARIMMADPGGAVDVERAVAALPGGIGLRGLHGSVIFGPRFAQQVTMKFQERFTEATAVYELAMAEAQHSEVPLAFSINYGVTHAETLFRLGRLAEAQQLFEQAMEDAPWLPVRWPMAAIGLAVVSFERDRPRLAASYCERIEAAVPHRENTLPFLWLWVWIIRANLALHAGDTQAACALMRRTEQAAEEIGLYELCAVPWAETAITACLRAGRLTDTQRIIGQLLTMSGALPCQWPRAIAARGQALLADQTGDHDTAHRYFKDALIVHESLPMPLAETETRLAYGGFLRRTGATTPARLMLHQAVHIAASCGAARLERLATEELHAAGGRRRTGHLDTETLTPVQNRIATLVANGLTNAEIGRQLLISHRTVEHHLTSIYAALGLSSRRQLRDLVKAQAFSVTSPTSTRGQDHDSA